jgi:hypothetical protein
MTAHTAGDDEDSVVDLQHGWSVYRCAHGCVHLTMDRFTLTLTGDELTTLAELVLRASRRFQGGADPQSQSLIRAH